MCPSSTTNASRGLKTVVAASLIGSTVEWYDFSVFSASSALVFDKLFFPRFNPTVGLLLSLLTYGVGYLARPIGGILFGHLGDRIGRKPILIVTFLVMGIATVLMGLLPTYQVVGLAAPVLLTVLRIVQGIAVGGEFGGAALLAAETAPPHRRGLYSSSALVGQSAGIVLGTAVFTAFVVLPHTAFLTWGWRAPFILSIILVALGLAVRSRVQETPAFRATRTEHDLSVKIPLLGVLSHNWRRLLLIFGARVGETMQYNVVAVFALSYSVKHQHVPQSLFLFGTTLAALTSMIVMPLGGALSDTIGRRPVARLGGLAAIATGAALFPLLGSGSRPLALLAIIFALGITVGLNNAVPSAYFPELFDVRHRYTAISLGYQLGTVIGGFTPALCTLLLAQFGLNSITAYLLAAGLLIFVCVTLLPETLHPRARRQPPTLPATAYTAATSANDTALPANQDSTGPRD